uniref:Glycosyltransferase n=1 Tax=viral metagenome TaxID=1070528 RepID=A0A6C0B973_9ZZZZ
MAKKYIYIILLLLLSLFVILLAIYTKHIDPFTQKRTAYLLTCNKESNRTKFSEDILKKIGFNVELFQCIKNEDKVLSNKISMLEIYKKIAAGSEEWGYVFEDDINVLDKIDIDELIQYENISKKFFYLGTCGYENKDNFYNSESINGKRVAKIKGPVRGLHAIALSKDGAKELLEFSKDNSEIYMDTILESFAQKHNPNVVRYDLVSPDDSGHRGIFFQDRNQFPTTI